MEIQFYPSNWIRFVTLGLTYFMSFSMSAVYLFIFLSRPLCPTHTQKHARTHAEPIIRLKVMSGKILIEWRHSLCKDVAKIRYMDPDITRSTHIDIANIFFNPEQDDSGDEISSEHNSGGKYTIYHSPNRGIVEAEA